VSGDYQSKLALMSASLRNDGRIWVPKKKEDAKKNPASIPEADRDYYLERIYPSFGNLAPRDISSRSPRLSVRDARLRSAGRMPPVGDSTENTAEDSRSNRRPIELIDSPAFQRSQTSALWAADK